jgi:hypothetical protein
LAEAVGDVCVMHLERGDQKHCDFIARTFRKLARYHGYHRL